MKFVLISMLSAIALVSQTESLRISEEACKWDNKTRCNQECNAALAMHLT